MKVLLLDPGTLNIRASQLSKRFQRVGQDKRDKDVSSLATIESDCIDRINVAESRKSLARKALNTIIKWGNFIPASVGLLQIAACLRNEGFEVDYLNIEAELLKGQLLGVNWLRDILRTRLGGVRVIGVTALTPTFPISIQILEICKSIEPSCTTVIGGHHASAMFEEIIGRYLVVDYVAIGEGEQTMVDFCKSIASGTPRLVPGLAGRINGTIALEAKRLQPLSLDELPSPAFDLIPCVAGQKVNYGMIMATRGCRFRCKYCAESAAFWGPTVRFRSPQTVADEICRLKNEHGLDYFYFPDSSLDMKRDYVLELAVYLSRIGGVNFACNLNPLCLDQDICRALLDAGFISFFIGMESFSDCVLKRMGRPSYQRFMESIDVLLKSQVPLISGTIMFGFPGETQNTIQETTRKAIDLVRYCIERGAIVHINPAIFTPYPGTPPFHHREEYGIRLITDDFSRFDRSTPVHDLVTLTSYEMGIAYESLLQELIQVYHSTGAR